MRTKPAADPDQRERFPAAEQAIGEDPAEWLNHDLADDPAAREMAKGRIRGLLTLREVSVFRQVEQSLGRGPRQVVLGWLDDRQEELAADDVPRGTLDEYLEAAPKVDPEPTESVARFVRKTSDGELEEYERETGYVSSPRPSLQRFKRRQAGVDDP